MRVSVWPTDAGYANYPDYRGARVTVDGKTVERVFTADDELGEVIVAALDYAGNVRVNKIDNEVVTQTLRGKVEIHKP